MKVDITTEDKINPKAIEYSFKLLLEDRTISILVYNLENFFWKDGKYIIARYNYY